MGASQSARWVSNQGVGHFKGIVHPKMNIYSPSCCSKPVWVSFSKEDTMKNVGNQTVVGLHWLISPIMEVCAVHQLFDYQHSSKYLLLCSTDQRNSYKAGWINEEQFLGEQPFKCCLNRRILAEMLTSQVYHKINFKRMHYNNTFLLKK